MKTNNLIGKLVGGIVGTAMLVGTAYASPREDLSAIRSYVKANPTLEGTINDIHFYGLRKGDMLIKTTDNYTIFEIDGKKFYVFCDYGNDGKIDRIVSMPADSPNAQKNEGRMDCLSNDSLEQELEINSTIRSMRPQKASNRIVFDANREEIYDFENNSITPSNKASLQRNYEIIINKFKSVLGLK